MKRFTLALTLMLLMLCSAAQADASSTSYKLEESDGNHVIVISRSVSVRNQTTRGDTISQQKGNTVMEIVEELEDWYGVITPEGEYGYVKRGLVQKDYKYITFLRPTCIKMLPFDDVPAYFPPEYVVGKKFLVISTYGQWFVVKLGNGIGYVRVENDNLYPCQSDYYAIFQKEDRFDITSYGLVYLMTDALISVNADGARIGERYNESFECLGYWGDYWLVKYGDGGALVKMDSPIVTQAEVDYYYAMPSKHVVTAWKTEVNGRAGEGSIGYIDGGTEVEVLAEEYPWYIIKYEFNGIPSIGWISCWDTIDKEETEK